MKLSLNVFNKRNLTQKKNDITGLSIASDVITIPAGTYRFKGNGCMACTSGDNHRTVCGIFDGDSGATGDLLLGGTAGGLGDAGNSYSYIDGIIYGFRDYYFYYWKNLS